MNLIHKIQFCVFLVTFFTDVANGSPGNLSHYFWLNRANAYAQEFCDGENPEYFPWGDDCTNFTSQIAQAGCAGMAEINSNNWGDYWVGPRDDCWLYYNDVADNNTNPWCAMDDWNYGVCAGQRVECHTNGQPWFPGCYIWHEGGLHWAIVSAQAQLN